tara:strand:- start:1672 stop:2412 length:741 start_codon:yes stop_codon:yes gene_type:complete
VTLHEASPYDRLVEAAVMDLGALDGSTSPFITLDACDGDLVRTLVPAIEASFSGNNQPWFDALKAHPRVHRRLNEQGIENPSERSSIQWDDPTLLFTATVELTSEGRSLPLGDGKARERIGRFPHGDGSPISYMIEYMRPNNQATTLTQRMGVEDILALLGQLNSGLCDQHMGHHRYNEGKAGLDIRGYLTGDEVASLRKGLAGRGWSVTADEPIDGGMRDASKNLIAVLRAAERRSVGVFLRSHS